MAINNFREKANFIWSIADLLRGHYKQADYGAEEYLHELNPDARL